jgi:glycosyltransferase involved in cell wall biosynthesis
MDRIVVGTTGGAEAPQMKYRLGPLSREGPWPMDVIAAGTFPSRDEVESLLAAAGPGRVLVLQRVLPSRREIRALRAAFDAVVFDFDDAIYAAMPDIRGSRLKLAAKRILRLAVRGSTTASSRRRRLTKVLREVDVCVVGNEILAQFARRYAKRVVEIPSTVEPIGTPPAGRTEPPVLVWTGVAGNRQYLELLREPLTRLAGELDFRLRIVCSRNWEDSPVDVEFVPWSQQAEHEALSTATVGLAPVTDDPFSRGKCQYRSLLFGGHGLPTVASPVGIMDRIVVHGETGFLARTDDEWLEGLRSCLSQPALAAELGAKALDRVRTSYSHQVGVERWTKLLNELAAGASPA